MAMIDTIRETQSRQIEQLQSVQSQIGELNERVADSVLGALPEYQLPFSSYLPKPTELVSAYWDWVGELHKTNRAFALRVVKAWENADAVDPARDVVADGAEVVAEAAAKVEDVAVDVAIDAEAGDE